MIHNKKVSKILYGGDYNPEQWPEEIWEEDMRLLKLAHIDIVTLNVFSWASLQRDDDEYHFEQLDKIMELVKANGLKVCFATSTAAHPAWMARKHPDILRTEFNGMKRKFGGRHNSCPNSPTYRTYSVRLAEKLAERYKNYNSIVAWHISNEYGGECYCENCEKQFRLWLKNKYHTIETLNKVWNTTFWGHTMYDWEDIVLPNMLTEHFEYDRTMFQTISLDYRRFNSDSMLECFRLEAEAVKKVTPEIPVTTNLMGFYKPLDYQKWAKYMDFVSWDSYPSNEDTIAANSLKHDLMRGLKQGMPFALMEQTPSVTNWLPYNALKRPGVMRLWSYQAVAHGADTVMFFQMRRSIGACEKYHGAVIDHVGNENTRVFREITELGEELDFIGKETLGSRTPSQVAIVFDWDNWWSMECSAGPSIKLKYFNEILKYYTALHDRNISVDIISVEDDLSPYQLVVAPVLYMIKGDYADRLSAYVKNGGHFITTFFSGFVDEHDIVTLGGYPGKLRELLGIWVEEEDALPEGKENHFVYNDITYPASIICDLLHLESAESLTSYKEDFYEGMPVLTCNQFGSGKAYYVATSSNGVFYHNYLKDRCDELNIMPVIEAPHGVEATLRENERGKFLFFLNHTEVELEIRLPKDGIDLITNVKYYENDTMYLKKKDVAIYKLS